MKLSIAFWLCAAGAVACSHDARPQSVPISAAATAAPLPYEPPLTPASGVGSPRTASASLVSALAAPTEPARDTAESEQDQESIREIRALLASDKALSTTTSQVTIAARDGRVWLRGQVNTAEQRAAIERIARGAGGVLDVKNELVVLE
jgi:BON domain